MIAHGLLLVGDKANGSKKSDHSKSGTSGGLGVVSALLHRLGVLLGEDDGGHDGRRDESCVGVGRSVLNFNIGLVHDGRLDEVADLVKSVLGILSDILKIVFESGGNLAKLSEEVVEGTLDVLLNTRGSIHGLIDELIEPRSVEGDIDLHVGWGLKDDVVKSEEAPDVTGAANSAGHEPVFGCATVHLVNELGEGYSIDGDRAADETSDLQGDLLASLLLLHGCLPESRSPLVHELVELLVESSQGSHGLHAGLLIPLFDFLKIGEVEVDADHSGLHGLQVTKCGAFGLAVLGLRSEE